MIKSVTLVTGNPNKLAAWRRMFPNDVELNTSDIDLEEIQSLDTSAIIENKAKRAYEIIAKPVIVEDITAGLDKLNGLPGPFIKFFEDKLGKEALYILAGGEELATVSCTAAYYDGNTMLIAEGTVHGKVVPARGDNGFGFDFVFLPDNHNKTYAEMTHEEKDSISHRHLAIESLVSQLKTL